MLLINLTPHAIHVNGNTIEPDKSYPIPRISMSRTKVDEFHGIPIYTNLIGNTENLPDKQDGVCYIVSTLVRINNPNRFDLISPGNLIRDDKGNIIGCDGFDINTSIT
jgi:hypothetical protein